MLEVAALRSQTTAKTLMPLFDCIVYHALVRAFPFLNDTLLQLIHIFGFSGCKPTAEEFPITCNQLG